MNFGVGGGCLHLFCFQKIYYIGRTNDLNLALGI